MTAYPSFNDFKLLPKPRGPDDRYFLIRHHGDITQLSMEDYEAPENIGYIESYYQNGHFFVRMNDKEDLGGDFMLNYWSKAANAVHKKMQKLGATNKTLFGALKKK